MLKGSNFSGFSLYELLMTVTLVALVLTLGIPSFGNIVANHRLGYDQLQVKAVGKFDGLHAFLGGQRLGRIGRDFVGLLHAFGRQLVSPSEKQRDGQPKE